MKAGNRNTIEILVADDDQEDRMLIIDALRESRLTNKIHSVVNGEELLEFLRNEGKYSDAKNYPTPGLILLDLNMPKKDGREALRELRADPRFRSIPVVVLTTSKAEQDILRTYDLGANSFITKPVSFSSLVETMRALNNYWFEIVELPSHLNEK
jgi:CheY-like chemotaxis protein